MGSKRPDLRSERLVLGSERPELWSERPEFRSKGLEFGSERSDLGSEKSDLGSERPNLGSGKPVLGSERLDLESWGPVLRHGRDGNRKPKKIALCGIIGHPPRSICPSGAACSFIWFFGQRPQRGQ